MLLIPALKQASPPGFSTDVIIPGFHLPEQELTVLKGYSRVRPDYKGFRSYYSPLFSPFWSEMTEISTILSSEPKVKQA